MVYVTKMETLSFKASLEAHIATISLHCATTPDQVIQTITAPCLNIDLTFYFRA